MLDEAADALYISVELERDLVDVSLCRGMPHAGAVGWMKMREMGGLASS